MRLRWSGGPDDDGTWAENLPFRPRSGGRQPARALRRGSADAGGVPAQARSRLRRQDRSRPGGDHRRPAGSLARGMDRPRRHSRPPEGDGRPAGGRAEPAAMVLAARGGGPLRDHPVAGHRGRTVAACAVRLVAVQSRGVLAVAPAIRQARAARKAPPLADKLPPLAVLSQPGLGSAPRQLPSGTRSGTSTYLNVQASPPSSGRAQVIIAGLV